MPAGVATPDSIGFLHDTSFQAPGVSLDPARLPANPCGTGSSIVPFPTLSPGFFQMSGGKLGPGESCTFTVGINVATTITPGSYTQLTGPVSTIVGGQPLSSPAVTAAWSVSAPKPATLAMEVLPNAAPAGEPRTLRYTLSLPADNATPDSIEFDHFVDFQAPGVLVDRANLPSNPCGTGSNFFFFANDAQFGLRDAALTPGASCSFDVPILVPSTLAPGDYGQLTGAPRTLIGATTLTSAAVSASFSVAAAATVANADTNTLDEHTTAVSGNVLGGAGAAPGDVADVNPNPAPQPVVAAQGTGGQVSVAAGGTDVQGNYGVLRLSGNGTYTYHLDIDLAAVRALRDAETLSDVFTYTTANVDGLEDSAALSVVITGVDEVLDVIESDFKAYEDDWLGTADSDFMVSALTPSALLDTRGFSISVTFGDQTASLTPMQTRGPLCRSFPPLVTDRGTLEFYDRGCGERNSRFRYRLDLSGVGFDNSIGSSREIIYVSVTDEEGDVFTQETIVDIQAAPPSNLTRSNVTLLGALVPSGTFAGTLASTDADSGLVFGLAAAGSSPYGNCTADTDNDKFRVTGDRIETTTDLTPGTYTICASVQNATGLTFQASFDIEASASDTAAPVITANNIAQPLDMGAATASVTLGATVTDNSGEDITPTYSIGATPITSPHAFPLGTTTVTARAEDAAGNVATETFDVTTAPDKPMALSGTVTGGTLRDGNPVTYQATLTNPNGVEVTDVIGLVAFGSRINQPSIGVLPAGMSFTYQSISGGCAGTLTQLPAPSSGGVAVQGLTVPAGATCTIGAQISVDGTTPAGSYPIFGFTEFDNTLGSFTADGTMAAVTVDTSDIEPPVITAPADQTASTDAGEASAALDVTTLGSVTDNSGVAPAITYRVGGTALTGTFDFPIGTTVVTMEATDAAGNLGQAQFDVVVSDGEAPVIVASDRTVATDPVLATARVILTATVSDNSGEVLTPVFSLSSGGAPVPADFTGPIGTTTIYARATDSAGNTGETSFDVTVEDTEPPVVDVINTIFSNLMPGQASIPVVLPAPVSDNSGGPIDIRYFRDPGGVEIFSPYDYDGSGSFSLVATDPSGNATTRFYNIVRGSDSRRPPALRLLSQTVGATTLTAVVEIAYLEPEADYNVTVVAPGLTLNRVITFSDPRTLDCPENFVATSRVQLLGQIAAVCTITVEFAKPSVAGDYPVSFDIEVDAVANGGSRYAVLGQGALSFTIDPPADTGPPTIDPITDIALSTTGTTAVATYSATASDPDDGDLSGDVTFSPPSGTAFSVGTTQVTAEVEDSAGNRASRTFDVTVTATDDTTAPVITAPADLSLFTDPALSTASSDVTGLGSVSDDFGVAPAITYAVSGVVLTGAFDFPLGDTVVTMDAEDAAGNRATQQSFTVTVSDNEVPVLTPPVAQAFGTDAGEASARRDVTGLGSVADNSGVAPAIEYRVGSTVLSGAFGFPLGTTTVTMDASDGAGNAAAQVSFDVTITDIEPPVIKAPADVTETLPAGDSTVSVAFSATVSDNVDASVSPVFRVGGSVVTSPFDFPPGTTAVTIDATDSAGNAASTESFTVEIDDPLAPTIALSADASELASGETAQITFTLSAESTDFAATSVDVTGGDLSDFAGSGRNYSATFTPTADSTDDGVISVPDGSFTDLGGRSNLDGADADNSVTITIDTLRPTATVTALSGPAEGPFIASIILSEASTDLTVDDLEVVNASASLSGSGTSYVAILTPLATGTVSVAVKAGSFSDAAGNENAAASNTQSASAVVVGPAVSIAAPGLVQTVVNAPVELAITFAREVTGFELADIDADNASLSDFASTDNITFTVTATPTADGVISVAVPADVAADLSGLANLAASPFTVGSDISAPVLTLTASGDPKTGTFKLLIDASEPIVGFSTGDIKVTGGTLDIGSFTGSGTSFAADISVGGTGTVTVDVAAGAARDLAGNETAAASITLVISSPEQAFTDREEDIIDTVQLQARQRLENEMSANGSMMDSARQRFMASASDPVLAFRDVPFDINGSAELVWGNSFRSSGNFFGQSMLWNGVMRTAQGQFDLAYDEETGSWSAQLSSRVSFEMAYSERTRLGTFMGASFGRGEIAGAFEGDSVSYGVIAGAYALTRLSENLYFDGYAALGYHRSELEFADDTLALDGDYEALSYYAGLQITGSHKLANGIEFLPNLSLDYGRTEIGAVGFEADAFGLSSDITAEFGAVSILELTLVPEMAIPVGELAELRIAPELITRKTTGRVDEVTSGSGLGLSYEGRTRDGRARYGIGLSYRKTGASAQQDVRLFYEATF